MPAGDFDYEAGGDGYAGRRRTDPRIAAYVWAALGDAATVINVGAGAGSYEPPDRYVVAVEPSAAMRAQRSTPAVDRGGRGAAVRRRQLRRRDGDDHDPPVAGPRARPARAAPGRARPGRDPHASTATRCCASGCTSTCPRSSPPRARAIPAIDRVAPILGGEVTVTEVPIPIDCVDGFVEAFYARPEALLDPDVRRAQSAWAFVEPDDRRARPGPPARGAGLGRMGRAPRPPAHAARVHRRAAADHGASVTGGGCRSRSRSMGRSTRATSSRGCCSSTSCATSSG